MPILFPGVADPIHIRLFSAGYIELGSWWTQTDRLRHFWRLYRNDGPGVSLGLRDGPLAMRPERIVVVPPGLDFECLLERPVRQLFCHFELVGWAAESVLELFPTPLELAPESTRDRLADELRDRLDRADRELTPELASRLKSLVHLSLADLLDEFPTDRAARLLCIADGQQELLSVLRYIDEHLDESLSNTQLAQIALASESRFIRGFRRATGQTPGRYVQDRRVGRAAEMLVSTVLSIDEIADRCGFANRYYFSRVFAQRMGRPPARYRSEGVRVHDLTL